MTFDTWDQRGSFERGKPRTGEVMGARDIVAQSAGRYLEWGVLQISVANLIIIGIMLGLFVLALFLPFPGRHRDDPERRS